MHMPGFNSQRICRATYQTMTGYVAEQGPVQVSVHMTTEQSTYPEQSYLNYLPCGAIRMSRDRTFSITGRRHPQSTHGIPDHSTPVPDHHQGHTTYDARAATNRSSTSHESHTHMHGTPSTNAIPTARAATYFFARTSPDAQKLIGEGRCHAASGAARRL